MVFFNSNNPTSLQPGMNIKPPDALTIESTLADLPTIDSHVDIHTTGEEVMQLFKQDISNPGVIVMEGNHIRGLISREGFFETTGKRFGVEIYLGRPISTMLEQISTIPLVLPANTLISNAIFEALKRESRSVYDPIVVETFDKKYRVLNILAVFLAENKILLTLHNQHTFTIESGIKLTDEEAVKKFIKFAGISKLENPMVLINRNSITCDTCGLKVPYTIPDVVRSHPQLSRGIEVTSRMGSNSYIFYVRHTCGNDIREIPVYHDSELNLRAIRPSRLVETYVNDRN